jgi:hypothetical protein
LRFEQETLNGNANDFNCKIVITLDFKFHKSTWLKGTIESNTKAELLGVYELWYVSANDHLISCDINQIDDEVHVPITSENGSFTSHNNQVIEDELVSDDDLAFFDCEEGNALLHHHPPRLRRPSFTFTSASHYDNGKKSPHLHSDHDDARDLAVNVVETIFVFAEFGYWKVRALKCNQRM